jgi:hypothetical protein
MKIIYTRKGEEIFVDDEDYERLNQHTWWLDKDGYAVRGIPHPIEGRPRTKSRMHREVMGLGFGDPREVDHRFGIRTDNRKSELRVCARGQNKLNRAGSSKSLSGLKGVKWKPRKKRWEAYIQLNRKRTYLGSFATAEEAHEAYCKAAPIIHGEFANTAVDSAPGHSKSQNELAVIAPMVKAQIGE